MTLLLDSRIGSADLEDDLKLCGIPVEVMRLEVGDAAWQSGDVLIGVERKTLGDAIRCIADGRFAAEQLPRLLSTYARTYLVIEGYWKESETGELLTLQGGGKWVPVTWGRSKGWRADALGNWRTSLEEGAETLRVYETTSRKTTANLISRLYRWWQPPLSRHKTINVIYHRPLPTSFRPPSLVAQAAALLPNIYEKAFQVADRFKTWEAMTLATEAEWREIDGIGKKTAKAVVEAIRGTNLG